MCGRKMVARAAFCNDMLFPFEANSRFCTFQGGDPFFFSYLETITPWQLSREVYVLTHELQRDFSSLGSGYI